MQYNIQTLIEPACSEAKHYRREDDDFTDVVEDLNTVFLSTTANRDSNQSYISELCSVLSDDLRTSELVWSLFFSCFIWLFDTKFYRFELTVSQRKRFLTCLQFGASEVFDMIGFLISSFLHLTSHDWDAETNISTPSIVDRVNGKYPGWMVRTTDTSPNRLPVLALSTELKQRLQAKDEFDVIGTGCVVFLVYETSKSLSHDCDDDPLVSPDFNKTVAEHLLSCIINDTEPHQSVVSRLGGERNAERAMFLMMNTAKYNRKGFVLLSSWAEIEEWLEPCSSKLGYDLLEKLPDSVSETTECYLNPVLLEPRVVTRFFKDRVPRSEYDMAHFGCYMALARYGACSIRGSF